MRKTVIRNGKKYLVTVADTDPFCDGGGYYAGGSLVFGGANRFLIVSGSTDFVINQRSFTVEWFQNQIHQQSFTRVFTQNVWPSSELGVSIEATSDSAPGNFYLWMDGLGNTPAVANSASISLPRLNQWDHFAVVRESGSFIQIFRNGTAIKTMTGATHVYITASISSSKPIIIGGEGDNVVNTMFSGSISSFRLTVGTALYSQSYTVPTPPLLPVSGTVLLISAYNPDAPFADSSGEGQTISQNSVSWSVSNPFYG